MQRDLDIRILKENICTQNGLLFQTDGIGIQVYGPHSSCYAYGGYEHARVYLSAREFHGIHSDVQPHDTTHVQVHKDTVYGQQSVALMYGHHIFQMDIQRKCQTYLPDADLHTCLAREIVCGLLYTPSLYGRQVEQDTQQEYHGKWCHEQRQQGAYNPFSSYCHVTQGFVLSESDDKFSKKRALPCFVCLKKA